MHHVDELDCRRPRRRSRRPTPPGRDARSSCHRRRAADGWRGAGCRRSGRGTVAPARPIRRSRATPVQAARPKPSTARIGPPMGDVPGDQHRQRRRRSAAQSRCSAPSRSPRFQASSGPTPTASISGTISGTKVRLKNGKPTDSFGPPTASRNSGYSVPRNTVAQPQVSSRLFSTSAPSREIGANSPPPFSAGARIAYSVSEPPIATSSSSRMNMPRARIDGEGVHRGQHARAHQERADQRQREGDDRQQDGPAFQRVALLHHDGRMDQRGADQPRHEARRSRPGPRTTSRPSRACSRPTSFPSRCRWSARTRRRASTAAPSAPRRHRRGPRSAPRRRRRSRPRSRHSRDRGTADGTRGRDPAAPD